MDREEGGFLLSSHRRISSGSTFEDVAGYSRAVVVPNVDGDWVFVSGTTGYDYRTGRISSDAPEQLRQCFRNIEWALNEAHAQLSDIVRVRIYCVSQAVFRELAPVIGDICRPFSPANTTVISALTNDEMLVEVEVTAKRKSND